MKKNDYIDTVEAMTALATVVSTRNKLNKISARTEDARLKTLIKPVIQTLDHSGVKPRVTIKTTQEPHTSLFKYCKTVIASNKPQWQILAEQNGWGPLK